MVKFLNRLTILLLLGSFSTSQAEETVRIAVGEWPPYLSAEFPHFGVAAHIVEESFTAAGVKVEFGFFPWNRVARYVEDGLWDTSILWVETEERKKVYLFSEVVFEGTAVFFHRRDHPIKWQTYRDFEGVKFGGLMSASYPWFESAKEAGVNMIMEKVSEESLNFAKLLSGRIHAFSLDKLVGIYILQKKLPYVMDYISYNPRPIESWPYRLIFTKSPRGEMMVNAFNRGLLILKEKGLIERHLQEAVEGLYYPREMKP
ncbi:substrate-binding periplasmic protein [Hahella ganghwensis]|uniref:substrate-binding periplasmic protein n=1 Tax=Hahella ganghwensis TaxID=286420 RepID=UPI000374FFB4|nr:transporter substrate-binding domain-containing protein [Hahella ganghwensis]